MSLRDRIRDALPPALAAEVGEVLEKPSEVVVFTESAAWAARLRIAVAELPASLFGTGAAADRKRVIRMMPKGGLRR